MRVAGTERSVPSGEQVGPAAASAKERILSAAKRLFAGQGYECASTLAVARLAATSESQLMKHFGNKQGLLEAIFSAGWHEITTEARSEIAHLHAPAEKLGAIAETVIRAFERDAEFKQLVLLEGRRVRRAEARVSITPGFLELVRMVDGVLGEMRDAGLLLPSVHLQAARAALMGVLEGLLRDRFLADACGYPASYDIRVVPQLLGLVISSIGPQRGTQVAGWPE